MKRFTFLLLCMTAIVCSNTLRAQTDPDMMKAWTAYMTPSDVHKMIAKSDGVWKTSSSMWMDPKGKPVVSTGTCTNKMAMGGRYQESTYTSTVMGMPFEGKGTLAYDNSKKEFQTTWIDNMGTGIMSLTGGKWDDATKTISFSGKMLDPMSGKDTNIRQTLTVIDDKNEIMTMYVVPDGGTEFKSLEVKYTR